MSFLYIFIVILIILIALYWMKHSLSERREDKSSINRRGYYDFHTHILYGIDHGASNLEMSISMLEKEAEEGISTVILTPHYFPGKTKKDLQVHNYEELKKELKKRQIPVEIHLGNELMYSTEALKELLEGKVCTLSDTAYVLTEFRTEDSYERIRNGLNEMIMAGFRPVLAHVERYSPLRDKKKVRELIQMGVLIQVNATSFSKKHLKKYLLELGREGMIHVVASDCHDLDSRPPGIQCGINVLEKSISSEQYEAICFQNPAHMLENQYI